MLGCKYKGFPKLNLKSEMSWTMSWPGLIIGSRMPACSILWQGRLVIATCRMCSMLMMSLWRAWVLSHEAMVTITSLMSDTIPGDILHGEPILGTIIRKCQRIIGPTISLHYHRNKYIHPNDIYIILYTWSAAAAKPNIDDVNNIHQ